MKNLLLAIISILTISACNGQLISDYPFKTYLDNFNDLYTAGFFVQSGQKDIYVQKFRDNSLVWDRVITNFHGDDVALDIIVDSSGSSYITGKYFNDITNSNDIIVIGLYPNGTLNWSKIYETPGDDIGMGISILKDPNGIAIEVFISGYVSNPITGKDFIIKKYSADNGDSLWQCTSTSFGDDVATDIVLDDSYAYVIGYATESNGINTDVKLMSFEQESGNVSDNVVYSRPGSNEKPTEFLISVFATVPAAKSRIAVVSVTDQPVFHFSISRYLTMYFKEDLDNKLELLWSRIAYNVDASKVSVPTSITKGAPGNIYVTGYMSTPKNPNTGRSNGLDYATIKYREANGDYGWQYPNEIVFTNYNDTSTTGMNDKASSIKINSDGTIFVAGMSEGSPNGYSIASIKDQTGDPDPGIKRAFIPNFLSENRTIETFNKWATLHLASDGTPLMVVMAWNENEAHWAAVKYDSSLNVEYTINNGNGSESDAITGSSETPKIIALKNYPNPFNPGTNLEFGISDLGFVILKVYDMLGKEVAVLVNEQKSSGVHSVKFDGSRLSSGIYYYTLSVDGVRMETKSMVLMK